jgi:hypothetical protein
MQVEAYFIAKEDKVVIRDDDKSSRKTVAEAWRDGFDRKATLLEKQSGTARTRAKNRETDWKGYY